MSLSENRFPLFRDMRLVRRHRDVDRRLARVFHPFADRLVISAVRLQIDIVAVVALDDVVVRLAASADQPVVPNRMCM